MKRIFIAIVLLSMSFILNSCRKNGSEPNKQDTVIDDNTDKQDSTTDGESGKQDAIVGTWECVSVDGDSEYPFVRVGEVLIFETNGVLVMHGYPYVHWRYDPDEDVYKFGGSGYFTLVSVSSTELVIQMGSIKYEFKKIQSRSDPDKQNAIIGAWECVTIDGDTEYPLVRVGRVWIFEANGMFVWDGYPYTQWRYDPDEDVYKYGGSGYFTLVSVSSTKLVIQTGHIKYEFKKK